MSLGIDDPDKEQYRIYAITCVEIIDGKLTKNKFHQLVNPGQKIDTEYLDRDINLKEIIASPIFSEIVELFLGYIKNSKIISHNCDYEISILNRELFRVGRDPIEHRRCVDSMKLAEKVIPEGPYSLGLLG